MKEAPIWGIDPVIVCCRKRPTLRKSESSWRHLVYSDFSSANNVYMKLATITFHVVVPLWTWFLRMSLLWKFQNLSIPKLSTLYTTLELCADLDSWLLFFLNNGGLKALLLVDASLDLLSRLDTSLMSNFKDLANLSISRESSYLFLAEEAWDLLIVSLESL